MDLKQVNTQTEALENQSQLKNFTVCRFGLEISTEVEHYATETPVKDASHESLGDIPDNSITLDGVLAKTVSSGANHRICCFMGADSLLDNEESLKDLTGVSMNVFALLIGILPTEFETQKELSWKNKLVCFLMKLKWGITYNALGVLFGVHGTTAKKYFVQVLFKNKAFHSKLRHDLVLIFNFV